MRQQIAKGLMRAKGLFVLLAVVLGAAQPAIAQTRIVIAPARGTTALSSQIQAEAAYVSAYGQMVESVATARKINAEAVAQEIQNSVEYVKAYFERRDINKAWREKENPNYLESEKKRQQVLERRIKEQYQDLLKGDVTGTMNWLLRELSAPMVAYQYIPGGQTMAHSQFDLTLSDRDLEQIRLTDGGTRASRLVFAAADGKPLQANWPRGLRGPQFAAVREEFEKTRDGVLAELQDKSKISEANQEKLWQTVNALLVALDEAYPQERLKDQTEFQTYLTAKRFLKTLVAATDRTINSKDAYALSGGLRFQGHSVVELIQHMYKNGLEFAPPESDGQGMYKTLFQTLRTLYVNIGSDRAPGDAMNRLADQPDPANK